MESGMMKLEESNTWGSERGEGERWRREKGKWEGEQNLSERRKKGKERRKTRWRKTWWDAKRDDTKMISLSWSHSISISPFCLFLPSSFLSLSLSRNQFTLPVKHFATHGHLFLIGKFRVYHSTREVYSKQVWWMSGNEVWQRGKKDEMCLYLFSKGGNCLRKKERERREKVEVRMRWRTQELESKLVRGRGCAKDRTRKTILHHLCYHRFQSSW